MGTTVYPCCWYARTARLPNFWRLLDAPMIAITLGTISARGSGAGGVGVDELEQTLTAFPEVLRRRRVRDADETGGVERLPGRDRDARFLEQRVGEIERRTEAAAIDARQDVADIDEHVECPGRLAAAHPPILA